MLKIFKSQFLNRRGDIAEKQLGLPVSELLQLWRSLSFIILIL